jgi:hypothetical protein
MICRVWHGWTAPANAAACERLLRTRPCPASRPRDSRGTMVLT